MFQVSARWASFGSMLAITVAAVATWALVTPGAAPAADSATQLPTATLLLDERFTAGGATQTFSANSLLALQGEREGYQLAINNTSGGSLTLAADVVADNTLAGAMASGAISFEVLRVGFVNVPKASTGLGTSAGQYADPLPPQRTDSGAAGMLTIPAGQWGGFAIIAKVRSDAPAGAYTADVQVRDAGNTVWAHSRLSLDVRNAKLLQTGDKGSFTTVMNIEGDAYWLQHDDMRKTSSSQGISSDRMLQLAGLMTFLDQRGITPLELPFGNPSNTGGYSCAWASKLLPSKSFLSQLTDRYFAGSNDIDPTRKKFPVRFAPAKTVGCEPDGQSKKFEATLPGPSSAKQDDKFNPAAPAFFSKVRAQWSSSSLWGMRTYVKHPFDEPSTANANYRKTMDVEVPKATKALRKAFGRKAKIMIADWPRDSTKRHLCRKYGSGKRCTNISGDDHSNKKTWDGRGSDDVDVWMVPFSRLFGRTTAPILKPYGAAARRDTEYEKRLKRIKKLRGGREVWAYNFYTADKRVPQLTIDAPSTDARLQYWLLAREGHTGLYVSNFMLGWGKGGSGAKKWPDGLVRKGNPYEGATYFEHKSFGQAAGWGTFIYPGYVPELGLSGELARNSDQSMPVSSLRLEGMRDGQEDANLIAMYRARFGDAKVRATLRSVFPGRIIPMTGGRLGNVTGLKYTNAGMAARMETVRRTMIGELTA